MLGAPLPTGKLNLRAVSGRSALKTKGIGQEKARSGDTGAGLKAERGVLPALQA
jgi:hypothetical protein